MGVRRDLRPICVLPDLSDVECNLVQTVEQILRKAEMPEKADEWKRLSLYCEDRDDVLRLVHSFVEIK